MYAWLGTFVQVEVIFLTSSPWLPWLPVSPKRRSFRIGRRRSTGPARSTAAARRRRCRRCRPRPTVRARPGMVVRQVFPCGPVGAVVLAHRAPLPLAKVGPHWRHGTLPSRASCSRSLFRGQGIPRVCVGDPPRQSLFEGGWAARRSLLCGRRRRATTFVFRAHCDTWVRARKLLGRRAGGSMRVAAKILAARPCEAFLRSVARLEHLHGCSLHIGPPGSPPCNASATELAIEGERMRWSVCLYLQRQCPC